MARFFRKNRGVTPSIAAPGVAHPNDATGFGPQRLTHTHTHKRTRRQAIMMNSTEPEQTTHGGKRAVKGPHKSPITK